MTKSELLPLLAEIGLRPSKKLGQNFLIDENLARYIAEAPGLESGASVLEVGPGTGALTSQLLGQGLVVHAIEYDCRLAEFLRGRFADCPGFFLTEGDVCRVRLPELVPPVWCIANLPYSVSGPAIGRFLDQVRPFSGMQFLLQKEMAERLAAEAGTKTYGALSVRVQAEYDVKLLRTVPGTVFWPPPAVSSAIVQLRLRAELPLKTRSHLRKLVQAGFGQRRKQLARLLGPQIPNIQRRFEENGIPAAARAEDLTPDQWIGLAEARCC